MGFMGNRTQIGGSTGPAFQEFFQNFESLLLDQQGQGNLQNLPGSPGLFRVDPNAGRSRSGNLAASVAREELGLTEEFGGQFLRQAQRLQNEAIEADPIASSLRNFSLESIDQASDILSDLQDGGLPGDVQRNIQESTRSGLAARGIIDSGAGAVVEASNLAGGTERFRQSRINQANAILQGGSAGFGISSVPGIRSFSPQGFSPSFQNFGGMFQSFIQPQQFRSGLRFQEAQEGRERTSSAIGSIIGGIAG